MLNIFQNDPEFNKNLISLLPKKWEKVTLI